MKHNMGIDESMGSYGILNTDSIKPCSLEETIWKDWNKVGDCSCVYSPIFNEKVLKLKSLGWGHPAFVYLPNTDSAGLLDITLAIQSGTPMPVVGLRSNAINCADWRFNHICGYYYSYGGYASLALIDSECNPAIYGEHYSYNKMEEEFTLSIERDGDGTTRLRTDGNIRGTINIPDNQVPNGENILIGCMDEGTIHVLGYEYYSREF